MPISDSSRENSIETRKKRDKLNAEWAFEMYWNLGSNRSLNKLWQHIKALAEEQGREAVPTKHKPDITRWRKDYHWDQRLEERLTQQWEEEKRQFAAIRQETVNKMHLMHGDVMDALADLITDRNTPNVRYRAIELWLKSLNISSDNVTEIAPQNLPPRPPEDASEEDLLKWFSAKDELN